MKNANESATAGHGANLRMPERISLVDQVVKTILEAVQPGGQWSSHLPGERRLADYLQVSRSTLRKALRILRRQRIIQVTHGQNAKVVTSRVPRKSSGRGRLVAILLHKPLHEHSGHTLLIISEIQRALTQPQYQTVPISGEHFFSRHPARLLERLVETTPAACWVLVTPSPEIISWFKKRNLPSLVIGASVDVGLPSFDRHQSETARHAAGFLLGMGHQRIALLLLKSNYMGQSEFRRGFLQAFEDPRYKTATPLVLSAARRPDAVWAAADQISQMKPRPTALVLAVVRHVGAAVSRFAKIGLRVPEEISMICLGDDPFLNYIYPRITHYTFNQVAASRRIAKAVRQIAEGGALPPRRDLIWPTFVRGNSVQAPSQPVE